VELSFGFTDLESLLRTISSIAVIAGSIFVVLQLRINAKMVRSRNAFDLVSKVVDPSFPARRHRLYEVSARYSGGDWAGFDRSRDDFEVRNFASIYEQIGLLARSGVVDLEDVMNALSAQPTADWAVFLPIRDHIAQHAAQAFPDLVPSDPAGIDAIYWPSFKWLAEENRKWVAARSAGTVP
jgi:hypothetical protein